MKVLITGSSGGIGQATVNYFLKEGHEVAGFDIRSSTVHNKNYQHHILDVRQKEEFPAELRPEVLIHVAGTQNGEDDIDVNLKGVIYVTEQYAIKNPDIKSVVIVGSSSGHSGSEFPEYAASKGGLIAYTRNVANRLAPRAICNSIDPGGVLTELNAPVMEDPQLWARIMALTPLKRWASPEEIAEWIYFVAVRNRFMTGQSLVIDGGESGSFDFVWPAET